VWVEKAFTAAPARHHQGHTSQTPSHTPSPRPAREQMISPPPTGKGDESASMVRKSALHCLSLPSSGNIVLQHGVPSSNYESNRLQDVEI